MMHGQENIKLDVLYLSHTRDPSLLSSRWYFSRSRIFPEVLLKIQNKKWKKKERKGKKDTKCNWI